MPQAYQRRSRLVCAGGSSGDRPWHPDRLWHPDRPWHPQGTSACSRNYILGAANAAPFRSTLRPECRGPFVTTRPPRGTVRFHAVSIGIHLRRPPESSESVGRNRIKTRAYSARFGDPTQDRAKRCAYCCVSHLPNDPWAKLRVPFGLIPAGSTRLGQMRSRFGLDAPALALARGDLFSGGIAAAFVDLAPPEGAVPKVSVRGREVPK